MHNVVSRIKQYMLTPSGTVRSRPVICVDVQPEYTKTCDSSGICIGRDIIKFVSSQTGPVLMFVNCEDQGMTNDTVNDVRDYWEEESGNSYDEAQIDWKRFIIVDKGYGYFRDLMDNDVESDVMIKLIRYMYKKRINDWRDIKLPPSDKRDDIEVSLNKLIEYYPPDSFQFTVNWTSVAQLKKFSGAYIVGGGRNECLREVELLMNAFNIKYIRINNLLY